jgi:VanZ family protein
VLETSLLAMFAISAMANLSLFDFELSWEFVQDRLGRLWAVPFGGYYWNPEFKAISDFLTKLGVAMPMGILFYLRFRPDLSDYGRALTAGWLLLTASFFAIVELGQVFLPTRFPESTDVLIGVAAVIAGMLVTRPFARS